MNQPFLGVDHVQLAMPGGEEDRARAFYAGILGLEELEKPAELRARGGVWFAGGSLQIHLGVERDFRPARKAHVALRCARFEELVGRIAAAGTEVVHAGSFEDGAAHAYVHDPFGNRIELVSASRAPTSSFRGYDHVDLRVRDLAAARALYDRLMPALGLTVVVDGETAVEYYEPSAGGPSRRFFGLNADPTHVPSASRIAFSATSRAEVDELAKLARAGGARDVEDPEGEYAREYYAVFFNDLDGNPLEICYRSGSA